MTVKSKVNSVIDSGWLFTCATLCCIVFIGGIILGGTLSLQTANCSPVKPSNATPLPQWPGNDGSHPHAPIWFNLSYNGTVLSIRIQWEMNHLFVELEETWIFATTIITTVWEEPPINNSAFPVVNSYWFRWYTTNTNITAWVVLWPGWTATAYTTEPIIENCQTPLFGSGGIKP